MKDIIGAIIGGACMVPVVIILFYMVKVMIAMFEDILDDYRKN